MTQTGIGKAAALRFHKAAWNVVATMRDPNPGADLAALDDVLFTRLDVLDQASINASVEAATHHDASGAARSYPYKVMAEKLNASEPTAVKARDDILADGWFVPPIVIPLGIALAVIARVFFGAP